MWITANAKKCVQCEKYIEKNGGCNHMTCKLCGKEFCWLCLLSWYGHDPLVCKVLQKQIEEKQKKSKDYAMKIIQNFQNIEKKYPNFEKTYDSHLLKLNSIEIFILNSEKINLNFESEILLGIIEFIKEAWRSIYFGLNLIFIKKKLKKAEKIEKICSNIFENISPIMKFFSTPDETNLKLFLQYLKLEKNVENLIAIKEDVKVLQAFFINIKLKDKNKVIIK